MAMLKHVYFGGMFVSNVTKAGVKSATILF